MVRQRDYAAEYARRMAGAREREREDFASGRRDKPDYDAREYARGHRGEAQFARMVKGADSVRVYGNLTTEGRAFGTVYKNDNRYTFRLYTGPPLSESQITGKIERWKDMISNVPNAPDPNIS